MEVNKDKLQKRLNEYLIEKECFEAFKMSWLEMAILHDLLMII